MRAFQINHLLAAASILASALAQTKLRIMPLGDSITEITCWRTLVWDDLQSAGVTNSIQFVGSMTDNTQNCQGNPGWDMHHEGHSGFLAIDIANNDLVGWLAAAKPDIVMFMLGTNDVFQGHSTTDIIAAYTKMVQEMRSSNPNMKIIVDLVIPLGTGSTTGITALNNAIPAWARGLNTTNSPITIADCNTGFPTSDLRDGVHPNAAGDAIIASRIFPVLLNTIKLALGGSPPVSSTSTTLRTSTTTTVSPTSTAGTGSSLYGQCGGIGWTGPTTCASGTCKSLNPYYSQCLP